MLPHELVRHVMKFLDIDSRRTVALAFGWDMKETVFKLPYVDLPFPTKPPYPFRRYGGVWVASFAIFRTGQEGGLLYAS